MAQTMNKHTNTAVVNLRISNFDVYIGRPSEWGNPFEMADESERHIVVKKYRDWLLQRPELLKQIPALKGLTLGCYCKPKACHGDVLVEFAEKGTPTFLDQFEKDF